MSDFRETTRDPEFVRAINYTQKLLDAAIDVVGAAPEHVELNRNWARDAKIVGLTILCRSISKFRAAVLLAQQKQALEAKALVRLLYENRLWLAALQERGLEFVHDMREDEAFNRRSLGEWTLKITSTQGGGIDGPDALKLRNLIKDQGQHFPKPKKLNAGKTAAGGAVEMVCCEYLRLSLDAVHCSVTALGHHLRGEHMKGKSELELSVVPRTTSAEVLSTVLHACRALLATARGAAELIGFATASATLAGFETEFVSNGWLER